MTTFTAGQYTLKVSDLNHVTLLDADGEIGSTNIDAASLAILTAVAPEYPVNNPEDEARCDELNSIIHACLYSNYNGYPALWLGDGGAICYDCGCQELAWAMTYSYDGDFTYDYIIDWAHSANPSGMSCDNSGRGCTGWCYEPFCADCGADESELSTSLVYNDSGDRCVCRDCIAKALHNERRLRSIPASDRTKYDEWSARATLAGVNTYDITRTWFDDTFHAYR